MNIDLCISGHAPASYPVPKTLIFKDTSSSPDAPLHLDKPLRRLRPQVQRLSIINKIRPPINLPPRRQNNEFPPICLPSGTLLATTSKKRKLVGPPRAHSSQAATEGMPRALGPLPIIPHRLDSLRHVADGESAESLEEQVPLEGESRQGPAEDQAAADDVVVVHAPRGY